MNTQKQILTTAALLTLFAVIGAGIVGLTYESTYDEIQRNEQQYTLRKLNTILPATRYDNDLLDDQTELPANPLLSKGPSIAYRAFKDGKPVATRQGGEVVIDDGVPTNDHVVIRTLLTRSRDGIGYYKCDKSRLV